MIVIDIGLVLMIMSIVVLIATFLIWRFYG
jgi:hypothetical protein